MQDLLVIISIGLDFLTKMNGVTRNLLIVFGREREIPANTRSNNGKSENGYDITFWTLKDEYKLVIPEVLVNEIISQILELLKRDVLEEFFHKTNAELIDEYIDKKVDQLNSAKINKLYSYLYPASLDLMDEEKK